MRDVSSFVAKKDKYNLIRCERVLNYFYFLINLKLSLINLKMTLINLKLSLINLRVKSCRCRSQVKAHTTPSPIHYLEDERYII